MWETWVRSLGQEDPLEKEMATRSSILAWRIPWTEELGGLQSMGCKKLDTTEQLHFLSHSCHDLWLCPSFKGCALPLYLLFQFCNHSDSINKQLQKKWSTWSLLFYFALGSCMHACMLNRFSSVRLAATLWTVAAKLLCLWDSPGKNTGMGCHFLLQQIIPTQGLNPSLLCLLQWQADSLPLVPPGKPSWFLIIHQIGNTCKKWFLGLHCISKYHSGLKEMFYLRDPGDETFLGTRFATL